MIRTIVCILLMAAMGAGSWGAPAGTPVGAPATRPATRPTAPTTRPDDEHRKVRQLMRKALDQVKAGKLEEAETTLGQALVIEPTHSTNLYNMACIKALRGRSDAAMDYLERSATEGFTDFIHMERDTDLDSLRKLDRYKNFVAKKDEWQRKAADKVIDILKREFGEGYLYEVDENAKLIFATNTDAATLAATKKWLVAQAKSQWEDLFEHRPDQYVSVILPSPADYRQIVATPGVGGFYNHDNRILIAQRLGQIMTHEFTHALHQADLDVSGQEHPVWLTEGLATMYEAGHFENDRLIPADNFRLTALKNAAGRGRLIPFEKLFKMDQRSYVNNATIAYGESGSLLLYLYSKDLLRKYYDAFKAGYEKDKTGAKALESVTGMSIAELEKDWREWMLQRTPPTLETGANGVVMGVRFGNGNDGLKIEQVFPKGPAATAGMKEGDVIVGINGADTRDTQSFVPLLALHKAGEKVNIKVRRAGEYLDVPVVLVERQKIAWGPDTRPTSRPTTRPSGRGIRIPGSRR